jgi:ABC-type phosphate transport system ATPase subunit
MQKIKRLEIVGLRGVRDEFDLSLDERSLLLYGDNGSGKSTIADVLEWFIHDRVAFLVGEEIGRKGYEALRNTFIDDEQDAYTSFEFSEKGLNNKRSLLLDKKGLSIKDENKEDEFEQYLEDSSKENLILRYRDLVDFVLSSKKEKLDTLSKIIGYAEVTSTRNTLKKVYNRLDKDIKTKNYEGQISNQQSQILEQFAQNITNDAQFIKVVNELVEPFEKSIEKLTDVNPLLKEIKVPDDSDSVNQETFLLSVVEKLVDVPVNIELLEKEYSGYKVKYEAIVSSVDKLRKLTLEQLLLSGRKIVSQDDYDDDQCPLCLTDKKQTDLVNEIDLRLGELKEIKKDQQNLASQKSAVIAQANKLDALLVPIATNNLVSNDANKRIKSYVEALRKRVTTFKGQANMNVVDGGGLLELDRLRISIDPIEKLKNYAQDQAKSIQQARVKDSKADVYGKIKIAGTAYAQIRKLKKERKVYESQRDTLSVLAEKFVERQKESLQHFLDSFSGNISKIYEYLNPHESVSNICLVPLERNEELSGVTIKFDFHNQSEVYPPHKYLSESHINCLGIAFFLSAVEAFNKRNQYIVLDDVISSFDEGHRKRFADLLVEQYSHYQIILLTHERGWFDIIKNRVRGRGWMINQVKYDELRGTYLDDPSATLLERIQSKLDKSSTDGLANDCRRYLEYACKAICKELGVKVEFRFNDQNEDRMSAELLAAIKGTLKKRKCIELVEEPIFDRLMGSTFFANKGSHDSRFDPSFADIKSFWLDICEFEAKFKCGSCNTLVSRDCIDLVNSKISCKKGELVYSWQ